MLPPTTTLRLPAAWKVTQPVVQGLADSVTHASSSDFLRGCSPVRLQQTLVPLIACWNFCWALRFFKD